MSRRVALVLVAVLTAAVVATPALGNGESLLTRALGIAETAKRKSETAKRKSNTAKRKANAAKRIARQSRRIARRRARPGPPGPAGPPGPQGVAGPQGPQGPGATTAFAEAPGTAKTTATADYEPLPGGPSVTVTVPASGLIRVSAQATLVGDESDGDGAVALYEDGSLIPGQAPCGISVALFEVPNVSGGDPDPGLGAIGDIAAGTPAALPFCGTLGPPSPVDFVVAAGEHTYELRYAACCGTEATFRERRIWVTPLPGLAPAPVP